MLKSFFSQLTHEAGCDEVGRGCIAGPVVASSVILPRSFKHNTLNDSKKLTQKQRKSLQKEIKKVAIAWGIGEASPQEVDNINVLNASFLAMHRAIQNMEITPQFLLIDGNRFAPYKDIPFECIIKGDGKYLSIAAASVLAKAYRDDLMKKAAIKHSCYGWDTNVGYPTSKHRKGIALHGITSLHRKSFRLLPNTSTLPE